MDTITALTAVHGTAAKVFHADGRVEPYSTGKFFTYATHPVDGLVSLAAVLTRIEPEPRTVIIRGHPTPAAEGRALVRRIKNPQDGDPAFFGGAPRRWIMVDIDGLACPDDMSPTGPEALAYAVRQLPPEFHDASFFYQWSSSAGLKGAVIKVHLFFCLDRPVPDHELREWAEAWNREHSPVGKLIDPALFDPIQAHYVAPPRFVGRPDPVPVRSGLVRKDRDEVAIRLLRRNGSATGTGSTLALRVERDRDE